MTIQEQIKNGIRKAMLEKKDEEKNLLRVVMGEFNRIDKELDDTKAISIIKKMVDNATEQGNDFEVEILQDYLPKQMDELELKKVLMNHLMNLGHAPTMKDMGAAMTFLKNNYGGRYDGKIASDLIKELLKTE